MPNPLTLIPAAALLATSVAGAVGATSDDFNDGIRGDQWSQVTDDPSLQLIEQAGRLNAFSAGPASPNTDALYLSDGPAGFRLSTGSDFLVRVDYGFTQVRNAASPGAALALVLGIGRDLDGTDSAAIGFGAANVGGFVGFGARVAHRTDDAQSIDATALAANSGTFFLDYDAVGDDLTLGIGGTPLYTLADTVRGVWGASDLLVSLGARGNGFVTQVGDAQLDNFVVAEGTIVPEPSSLGIAMLGLLGACRRRR
jgi:hypothetical protein